MALSSSRTLDAQKSMLSTSPAHRLYLSGNDVGMLKKVVLRSFLTNCTLPSLLCR